MPTITALIRSSRDHGTLPRFMDNAATSQYNQKAAHPTAKAISTARTGCQSATGPPGRRGGYGYTRPADAVEARLVASGGAARAPAASWLVGTVGVTYRRDGIVSFASGVGPLRISPQSDYFGRK